MKYLYQAMAVGCLIVSGVAAANATAQDLAPGNDSLSDNDSALDNKGHAIISEVIARDDGFGDFHSDVEMTIVEGNGDKRVRRMQISNLEITGGGEKRLFVFDFPRDVEGTAVLSHTQPSSEKQWIFLPAFKRIKRISSANKSSPFVGSEFSYEDLASVELEKYQYRYINTVNNGDCDCYVVEMQPTYDNSGYQKQVAYVDREEFIFRKMEYYDRDGKLLKTLQLDNYKRFIDRYWRPLKLKMINHQNQRKTLMMWRGVKYRNGYNDRDLSVNALKRAR